MNDVATAGLEPARNLQVHLPEEDAAGDARRAFDASLPSLAAFRRVSWGLSAVQFRSADNALMYEISQRGR
jgi:hypothetical protein